MTTPPTHNTTITEKKVFSISAPAALLLALTLLLIGLALLAVTIFLTIQENLLLIAPAAALVIIIAISTGFTINRPGETKVVTFLGNYIGTLRTTGLSYVMPLTARHCVPVKINNFESKEAKVNDINGNPINISAIVVWQVDDTAKASFVINDYEDFITKQSESAIRHIVTQYPYDTPDENATSLRRSTDEISAQLAAEISERVREGGMRIIEARISSLSYAPEIAQAMLQRQQAQAIVDARQTIVNGAVDMVETSIDLLEQRDIVDLDPERKAAMVSNLLVVLCSDGQTQPVINTGGLYS